MALERHNRVRRNDLRRMRLPTEVPAAMAGHRAGCRRLGNSTKRLPAAGGVNARLARVSLRPGKVSETPARTINERLKLGVGRPPQLDEPFIVLYRQVTVPETLVDLGLPQMRRRAERDLGHGAVAERREPAQRLRVAPERGKHLAAQKALVRSADERDRRDVALRISGFECLQQAERVIGPARRPRDVRAQSAVEVTTQRGRVARRYEP